MKLPKIRRKSAWWHSLKYRRLQELNQLRLVLRYQRFLAGKYKPSKVIHSKYLVNKTAYYFFDEDIAIVGEGFETTSKT
jgi:hypothetical protein